MGTAYEIDREQLAGWLALRLRLATAPDSKTDRTTYWKLLSDAAIGMVHLSRFAEDLIFLILVKRAL